MTDLEQIRHALNLALRVCAEAEKPGIDFKVVDQAREAAKDAQSALRRISMTKG